MHGPHTPASSARNTFPFKMVSMCSEKPVCAPPHLSVSPTSPLSTPLSWTVSLQHSRSSRCSHGCHSSRCSSHGCHVFTLMSCHWNRFNGYCSKGKTWQLKYQTCHWKAKSSVSDKVTVHDLKVYLHNYQRLVFIPLLKKVPFARYTSHVLGAG